MTSFFAGDLADVGVTSLGLSMGDLRKLLVLSHPVWLRGEDLIMRLWLGWV